jgi:hypothetical protein
VEEKAEHPRDSALSLKGMVECVAGEANLKREDEISRAASVQGRGNYEIPEGIRNPKLLLKQSGR